MRTNRTSWGVAAVAVVTTAVVAMALGVVTTATAAMSDAKVAPTLSSMGYTLLPQPQSVVFGGNEFPFGPGWHVTRGQGVAANDTAIEALVSGLSQRNGVRIHTSQRQGDRSKNIELMIKPDSVAVGAAQDANKVALAQQAYKLDVSSTGIDILANTSTGLFYGVESLVQLAKKSGGRTYLPVVNVTDWPDLQRRNIFWDDSEHLDHLDVLEAAVRQAAFYKVNGFVLKLDAHFQYKSAPAVVDPEALSPAQLQELTNYGLKYHVNVSPFLDAPGHVAWILKHPEYANLREYPDSNYEICSTNPKTYKLLEGMYQDLLNATKGSDWFVLSTDEPYYVGLAKNSQCDEQTLATQLGSVGKVEAQFLDKAAGYIHDQGRTVQFWGEYPLTPQDIPSLPSYLVNGETYGSNYDSVYAANGNAQTIYTWVQGTEFLFPPYYDDLTDAQTVNPAGESPRIPGLKSDIATDTSRTDGANLVGVFVAAWADSGLNPETFWMGFITGASWAWNPASPDPNQAANSFYKLFYGAGTVDMGRVYQLMSEQAEFFQTSWDTGPSTARSPIWGNSHGQFTPPRPAKDQSIPVPGIPTGSSLQLSSDWNATNARRLQLAQNTMKDNEELTSLLKINEKTVQFGQYNLRVYESIAQLDKQNLQLLANFGTINNELQKAQADAAGNKSKDAVAAMDAALRAASVTRQQRNDTLSATTNTWYQSMYPRVAHANGRTFLFQLDDVKDHLPERTVDMSYLIYRELLLPMDNWYNQVQTTRNQYAKAHGLSSRTSTLSWSVYN